jgi:hypothetical protein
MTRRERLEDDPYQLAEAPLQGEQRGLHLRLLERQRDEPFRAAAVIKYLKQTD